MAKAKQSQSKKTEDENQTTSEQAQSQENETTEATQETSDDSTVAETQPSTDESAQQGDDAQQPATGDDATDQQGDETQQEGGGDAGATDEPAAPETPEPSDDALAKVKATLDDYIEKMAPNVPNDEKSIAAHQLKLRKALNQMLRVADEQFEDAIKLFRTIVQNHRDGVFSERLLYRGFPTLKISAEERKRMETLMSIMLAYADSKQKSQVPAQIDFNVAMRYIPKEDEQEKLRSFFVQ